MAQYFSIHPENPQGRLIAQAVQIIRGGGVVAYPTDSGYALGCLTGDKQAVDRIRQIRKLPKDHNFTLVCKDLSEVGTYAKVNNSVYRYLKNLTPGSYTFILKATAEVPRRLMHDKRKTIGLRVPDNKIALAMLQSLGEPLMSVSLILPSEQDPEFDPEEIVQKLSKQLDLVIDGGVCPAQPTTVLDFQNDHPELIREGAGAWPLT